MLLLLEDLNLALLHLHLGLNLYHLDLLPYIIKGGFC